MLIDFHTHIFPDKVAVRAIPLLEAKGKLKGFTDGTLSGLIKSMDKDSYSVIMPVPTEARQVESINNFAITNYNMANETHVFSFGGMHPEYENYKSELDRLKENGIKGIKIHPDYQGIYIDDIRYINIIDYAFEIGLIVLTHAGIDIGLPNDTKATPDRILNLLSNLKHKGTFILAHMGGWKMWDIVLDKLMGKDLYFDTAFSLGEIIHDNKSLELMDEKTFKLFIKKAGSDHILFGSDSPWGNAKDMEKVLKSFNLDEKDLSNITYLNALKILNIKNV